LFRNHRQGKTVVIIHFLCDPQRRKSQLVFSEQANVLIRFFHVMYGVTGRSIKKCRICRIFCTGEYPPVAEIDCPAIHLDNRVVVYLKLMHPRVPFEVVKYTSGFRPGFFNSPHGISVMSQYQEGSLIQWKPYFNIRSHQ
jgi:hypothetical protein